MEYCQLGKSPAFNECCCVCDHLVEIRDNISNCIMYYGCAMPYNTNIDQKLSRTIFIKKSKHGQCELFHREG